MAKRQMIASDESRGLNCMEVWGGHGDVNACLTRPGLDLWIRSHARLPRTDGGGDLHLVSSCASGRITRMLLADVSGFDSVFRQISCRFRDLMKNNINSIQQTRAERQMASQLQEASHQGGYASTLISTYFAPNRCFTFCNTGHPPPLLFRARTGEWFPLKPEISQTCRHDQQPGIVGPGEYQQQKCNLQLGDMVLSFSNALTECRRADGRTIGIGGLLDRVRQLDPAIPSDIPSTLIEWLIQEQEDNLTSDESTILLCRVTDTPVGWKNNLLAPFRLLRAVSDHTQLG